jgi:hypothetical protein
MGAMNDSCTWTDLKHRVGDQDGSVLERQSRCVMIAGRGRRARSADMHAWLQRAIGP